jgi:hypothetical protein
MRFIIIDRNQGKVVEVKNKGGESKGKLTVLCQPPQQVLEADPAGGGCGCGVEAAAEQEGPVQEQGVEEALE